MSGIPSDIAGSALQAGYQAREAARTRDGQRAGEAAGASRQVRAVDESTSTVDTSDEGTQVFTDAEGTGGQGRQLEEEEREETLDGSEGESGLAGDGGEGHSLDIQA